MWEKPKKRYGKYAPEVIMHLKLAKYTIKVQGKDLSFKKQFSEKLL
jgi:hypothetical protein